MLTLKQFAALAESYGGDLRRWPANVREQAEALLHASPQARAMRDRAAMLDAAVAAAGRAHDRLLWPSGAQTAALVRLRAAIAARIAVAAAPAGTNSQFGSVAGRTAPFDWIEAIEAMLAAWPRLGWLGIAIGSGVAVAAGLLLGMMYAPTAPSDGVLAMLQAAPVQLLAD